MIAASIFAASLLAIKASWGVFWNIHSKHVNLIYANVMERIEHVRLDSCLSWRLALFNFAATPYLRIFNNLYRGYLIEK